MAIIDDIKVRHGINKEGKYEFEKNNTKLEKWYGEATTFYWFDEDGKKIDSSKIEWGNFDAANIVWTANGGDIAPLVQKSKKFPEEWDEEFAAQYIEKVLGIERGESTIGRFSITGEEYRVIAGEHMKYEGEKIKFWDKNPYIAWSRLLKAFQYYWVEDLEKYKIYWRWMPRLEEYEGKYCVIARFLISDKPQIYGVLDGKTYPLDGAAQEQKTIEKIGENSWIETLGFVNEPDLIGHYIDGKTIESCEFNARTWEYKIKFEGDDYFCLMTREYLETNLVRSKK